MNRAVKWILVVIAGLVLLVVAALVVIPNFVDLNRYRPQIEQQVAEATGRPFALEGELDLSLFPWAGVALSGLHLGNPPGFMEKDFISVKSFEVRVKLFPLLFKEIQVKRFVVDTPRLVLIRNQKGLGNWEDLGQITEEKPAVRKEEKVEPGPSKDELPIQSLEVGEFAVKNGSLLYMDKSSGSSNEISDLNVTLDDVSFDHPILIDISAQIDGNPLAVKGQIGPVGKELGENPIPIDIGMTALKEINLKLKGTLQNLTKEPRFDLVLDLAPFSPRNVLAFLGQELPMESADLNVLSSLSLKAGIKGTPQTVSVSGGVLELDDSKIDFTVQAREFEKPDLSFNLNLDRIDVDRYLPLPEEEVPAGKAGKAVPTSNKKTDYTSLRKLVLNGILKIGDLKIQGAKMRDISVKMVAANGRYTFDPVTLEFYDGDVSANAVFDVRSHTPRTSVNLQARQLQVNPLLVDVVQKDVLEGTLKTNVSLNMEGDDPDRVKQTLNGKGDLLFNDGAIKGVDLAGMARNAKAAFGLVEKNGPKPRTDFSAIHVPFTFTNGRFNTSNATLASPLLRLAAVGTADLVKETLDFRVEPKIVGTIKGQGDTEERGGIMVPILVSGKFAKPSFKPDLEGMAKKTLQEALTDPDKLKDSSKETLKSLEEQGKGLLKELRFGN